MKEEIDTSRAVREIAVRLSPTNAMCALTMNDENGDPIVDIEWENLDVCREWKKHTIPEGHEIIGLQTNTTNDQNMITRLGFVLRKIAWKWEMLAG